MIVLITGGREFRDNRHLNAVLNHYHAERVFTYLVHGDAPGADQMGHRWAKKNGVQPVAMEALWDFEGNAAGTRRNLRMVRFTSPALCIGFAGGRGTANCMRVAREHGIELIDANDVNF